MIIMMMIGITNLSLNENHRLKHARNFVETHIKRSNIQNSVIPDEITRNETENR
jgi:hypothetical protein